VESKLTNQDYVGLGDEQALDDFMQRVKNYREVYQTINDYEYQVILTKGLEGSQPFGLGVRTGFIKGIGI
jgi:hypothetical protein